MGQESEHREMEKLPHDASSADATTPRNVHRRTKKTRRLELADRLGLMPESFHGYIVRRVIKRGGQGIVLEATHEATQRTVAIKVTYDSIRRDPTSRVRIAREVEVLSQLRHPNIVRLTDGGEVDGRFYFVTDFITGAPLSDYLTKGDFTIREKVELFATICDASYAAHRRGIVHRDLKPSNVLVDDRGHPHILDFGLAKLTTIDEHTTPKWEQMTATGQFMGSLPWATPEQVEGDAGTIDCRTDVYALGVMLYQALTNRFPYDIGTSTRSAMENILHATPTPLSYAGQSFDDDLQTIVMKCLSKEPHRRYAHAGALSAELRRYLAGEPIDAKRDSRCYVFAKAVGRHRTLAFGIATAAVMTVVYAITMTVLYQHAATSEQRALHAATRAQAHAGAQRETLDFMVGEVSSKLATIPGAIKARQILLEGAYERLTKLEADATAEPEFRARTLGLLGDIAQALGDFDCALRHTREALRLYEGLSQSNPDNADLRADLSIALVRVGDVLGDLADYEHRRLLYDRALAIDESLVQEFPDNTHFRDNLLWSYERIATDTNRAGDPEAAKMIFRQQRTLAEQLLAEEPDESKRFFALHRALRNLDAVASTLGDVEGAQAVADELLALAIERAKRRPEDATARFQLTDVCWWAGTHAASYGNIERADELLHRALILARNDSAESDDEARLAQFVRINTALSEIRRTTADSLGAEPFLNDALGAAERLLYLAPHAFESQRLVFRVLSALSYTLDELGRHDAAEGYSERAVRTGEHMLETGQMSRYVADGVAAYLAAHAPSKFRNVALMTKTLEKIASDRDTPHEESQKLLEILRRQSAGARLTATTP